MNNAEITALTIVTEIDIKITVIPLKENKASALLFYNAIAG
ncbi:hypothetical protein [Erwinia sp. 198]|nr:hypothetical protein [Erwinia sp. 198]